MSVESPWSMGPESDKVVDTGQNLAFNFCIRSIGDEGHGIMGIAIKIW